VVVGASGRPTLDYINDGMGAWDRLMAPADGLASGLDE